MKDFNVELTDEQKSEVRKIYRRYYRGKWYHSETQAAGYEEYYYATKMRTRLYYKDEERAQKEADKYNKRLKSYKKGRAGKRFPSNITWDMLNGTEVHNQYKWEHGSGSWLYGHRWLSDEPETEDLLEEDIDFVSDDGHTTREFFEILFMKKYPGYELYVDEDGNNTIVYK